jgi:hypothetical protein
VEPAEKIRHMSPKRLLVDAVMATAKHTEATGRLSTVDLIHIRGSARFVKGPERFERVSESCSSVGGGVSEMAEVCEVCNGKGGHSDADTDQWYWCQHCDAHQRFMEAQQTALTMSSCQRRDLERIAKTWKHIGPHDYGKHDVIEFLAHRNGWNPLVIGESMSVGIGSRRYEIKRVE